MYNNVEFKKKMESWCLVITIEGAPAQHPREKVVNKGSKLSGNQVGGLTVQTKQEKMFGMSPKSSCSYYGAAWCTVQCTCRVVLTTVIHYCNLIKVQISLI